MMDCGHPQDGAAADSWEVCHRKTSKASMQRFALTFALLLDLLPWRPPADGERIQSTKKLGKNYHVVRKPNSGDCKVEPKKVPNDFIMVGQSPYASQKYAEAAIETFPECSSARKKRIE
jgi:hypothetical protein